MDIKLKDAEEIKKQSAALKALMDPVARMGSHGFRADQLRGRINAHLELAHGHAVVRASVLDATPNNDYADEVLSPVREDRVIALAELRAALRDAEALLIERQLATHALQDAVKAFEATL